MKRFAKKILVSAMTLFTLSAIFADEKGTAIMQRADDKKEPKFTRSMVTMELKDKSGDTEVRNVIQYGKDTGDKTYVVMDFKGPASVKDTRFLQITNKNSPDDKWIYLPGLKSVRRVNSSEGSKSFIGTDATYDDLSTREMDEDEHIYLRDEKYTVSNGTEYDCEVVKNVPIDKKSSQYAYRIVWVDKKTSIPVHSEMYDKNDKMVKELEVLKIENISGYDVPMENRLTTIQTGHSTTLKILKIVVDTPLPDRVFTQSFLSTGK